MHITIRKPIMIATAGALTLSAASALATTPSGETPTPLAGGALVAPANVNRAVTGGQVKIRTHGALEALMLNITLAPGGTGGWHKHAGPLISIVKQGTLTIIDAKCRRHDIPAGHAVISPGNTREKDENRGSTPVVLDVTFLLPRGLTSPRIDTPAPTGCTA
jgi:quercetin dioxygenase-like cupin family protein